MTLGLDDDASTTWGLDLSSLLEEVLDPPTLEQKLDALVQLKLASEKDSQEMRTPHQAALKPLAGVHDQNTLGKLRELPTS
ncbi:hypothetical protein GH714_012574 [Hevea brasiliensis]|uniref:Uncharacterized protein n=1 Tax=Hevea brasiliensis TaxID=3981 RepID=A0A6A6MMU1_HEVBR|nr:hypothetical protein GH714_012574 [Hevea brasiliensis]